MQWAKDEDSGGENAMGMDGVELIIETEERFGVMITNAEASRIFTVGEFHQCVLQHLLRNQAVCLTSAMFYDLRRLLMSELNLPKQAIRPSADLASLIPKAERPRIWQRIREQLSTQWLPDLRRPRLMVWLMRELLLVMAIVLIFDLSFSWALVALVIGAAGLFLRWITQPYATQFNPELTTVRSLVYTLLPPGTDDRTRVSSPLLSSEQLWNQLVELISHEFGIDPQEITRNTRFIEDLQIS